MDGAFTRRPCLVRQAFWRVHVILAWLQRLIIGRRDKATGSRTTLLRDLAD